MEQLNNNQVLATIAQSLIKAREGCSMKQDGAAKALGISRSTLSKYENGDLSGLSIENLLAISKLYGKPLMYFFPSEPAIHFNFNPSDDASNNSNQQAYMFHNHSDGYKELIAHLKEEIEFLREGFSKAK